MHQLTYSPVAQCASICRLSDEVEIEVPIDNHVHSAHKAETLVRLKWDRKPSTFLLLKKPGHSDITAAMQQIAIYLTHKANLHVKPTLVVEPSVFNELQGDEMRLWTWRQEGLTAHVSLPCLEISLRIPPLPPSIFMIALSLSLHPSLPPYRTPFFPSNCPSLAFLLPPFLPRTMLRRSKACYVCRYLSSTWSS